MAPGFVCPPIEIKKERRETFPKALAHIFFFVGCGQNNTCKLAPVRCPHHNWWLVLYCTQRRGEGAANLVVEYFRGERRNWIWSPEAASMMITKTFEDLHKNKSPELFGKYDLRFALAICTWKCKVNVQRFTLTGDEAYLWQWATEWRADENSLTCRRQSDVLMCIS